ncbi:MAG: hypothetical protein NC097_04270 [Clostridium sp.]|nr:hypothetical protein [Prevotella sp.]MCM1428993.1 hypothetical protein [Clostridium sp.]MCM1475477.1 hypothetical protein [Muribaculaceae bacterium]
MGYFFLLVFLLVLTWPLWKRWFYGFAQRRSEDFIRRMMGLPTRKEEKRQRKAREKYEERRGREWTSQRRGYSTGGTSIIPQEYAEDVKFTEIRDFKQTTISEDRSSGQRIRTESQVEDVEFVEIKNKPEKE